MKRVDGPIKCHGGKHYLASNFVAEMPPRFNEKTCPDGWRTYAESHCGGASVLFANDPEGISEIINDIDGDVTNFWDVLTVPVLFKQFERAAQATPFSEKLFDRIGRDLFSESRIEWAWNFFVRCRQSMAGRMKSFAPISSTRVRRGMNEQVSAWLSTVDGLTEVHRRLRRVLVRNLDGVEFIEKTDGKKTLFYVDPTYLQETRTAKKVYKHEMTPKQHHELLTTLGEIQGRFMLSGYRSTMYDEFAKKHNWLRKDFTIDNKAASGKQKRTMTESLWFNY